MMMDFIIKVLISHEIPAFLRGWFESGCFLTEGCIGLLSFSAAVAKIRESVIDPAHKRLTRDKNKISAVMVSSAEADSRLRPIAKTFKQDTALALRNYNAAIKNILAEGTKSCWACAGIAIIILALGIYHIIGPFVLILLHPIKIMYSKAEQAEIQASDEIRQAIDNFNKCLNAFANEDKADITDAMQEIESDIGDE